MIVLQLKEQARESESTRRKLESARQEVFQHMTKMRTEKESLEREVRKGTERDGQVNVTRIT